MINADKIAEIIAWIKSVSSNGDLYSDSRQIKRADHEPVFFAYPGDENDGRDYIEQAIAAGARAVIYEKNGFKWNSSWFVPSFAVKGLKECAGNIASDYYGNPSKKMFSVAVTGTNGKTSCTQWISKALSRDFPSVVVGTLGIGVYRNGECKGFQDTGYTTPDAVFLQRCLDELIKENVKSLAIEASSIGLDQGRLNGLNVDVALFTNFTRDHLDYHKDMRTYEEAKKRLFDWPGLKSIVINADDELGLYLIQKYGANKSTIAYTLNGKHIDGIPFLSASKIKLHKKGTEFHVDSPFGSSRVVTHLVGRFNVSNVLGVLGVLLAKGFEWKDAVYCLGRLQSVAGRMQQLGGRDAPMVVIDYAHTPDALEKVLLALRNVAHERKGDLWCVFGCGGDRDSGKRAQMGAMSEIADQIVVTSDNPRGEEPQKIIEQIVSGMKKTPQTIVDRAKAILYAVKHAKVQDVILIAGKGHERYQEIKGVKYPFLDEDHASLALANLDIERA